MDHYTHHDPAVRKLIQQAQAAAWDDPLRFDPDRWAEGAPRPVHVQQTRKA